MITIDQEIIQLQKTLAHKVRIKAAQHQNKIKRIFKFYYKAQLSEALVDWHYGQISDDELHKFVSCVTDY